MSVLAFIGLEIIFAVFLGLLLYFIPYGLLLTAVGRAEWRRERRIAERTAELIERGYSAGMAKHIAQEELSVEANRITKTLRDERIEV